MVKIHNIRHKHIFCWFYTSQKDKKEDWGGKREFDGEIGTVKKTARQTVFVYVFVCRGVVKRGGQILKMTFNKSKSDLEEPSTKNYKNIYLKFKEHLAGGCRWFIAPTYLLTTLLWVWMSGGRERENRPPSLSSLSPNSKLFLVCKFARMSCYHFFGRLTSGLRFTIFETLLLISLKVSF